jgi:acetyl-CoA carboxylase biotin carboxylase subunit
VAANAPLSIAQGDVSLRGHAIECRVNAEDPAQGFAPSPGVITRWEVPRGEGVRVETHVEPGYEVPPFYDSLICKVIAHAETRERACAQMIAALEGLVCEGVATTVPMHLAILRSDAFENHQYTTREIPGWPTSR